MANTYSDLATKLWEIQLFSQALTGHAKADSSDEGKKFWQRLGSTRFAAEKQRIDLQIQGKLKGLKAPTIKAPTNDKGSFEKLQSLCLEAAGIADTTEGEIPTATARAKMIGTSMRKQATLLDAYLDYFFGSAKRTEAKKDSKAKKTA